MTTSTEMKKRKPSHIAYSVRDIEGGKGFFNRVGVAFAHKDGKGLDILLDAIPLDGKICLREYTEKPAE